MTSLLVPRAASAMAVRVDDLYFALIALCGAVALIVAFLLVYFSVKYRRGSGAARTTPRKTRAIEIAWALSPLVIFFGVFVYAARLYITMEIPPPDALPIYVVAKQWMWKLEHPEGRREIDTLHVPAHRDVQLIMISQDVIHSFYLPAFRLKQDVLPGRYTSLWFRADRTGTYSLRCAEFCGARHAYMGGKVVVMAPQDYARWLRAGTADPLARTGAKLFSSLGCSGCHGPHSSVHAPRLAGVFGGPVPLSDGSVVRADEAYVRDSILLPNKQVVAGYAPIMPSFAGRVDESQIIALVAYIKSLSVEPPR